MLHLHPFQSVESIRVLTNYLWLLFLAILIVGAFAVKPAIARQSVRSRMWYSLLVVLGAYLIFAPNVDLPWINVVLWRVTVPIACAGFAIVCMGIAFAIWARMTLGGNWSGVVTIKRDHTLVRRGPYRIVRHPIYTGLLAAFFGSALQYGYLRSLAGVLLCGFGFRIKSLIEEQFMAQRFGEQYLIYRQQVRALVPFIF